MTSYKIKGDLAFTQDNILVQKLLVTSLPAKATSINVAEHFQRFGKVGNVQMLGAGEGQKCVIHFDDPKDAARVLQKKSYLFMNSLIRLGAYDSSFQPEGQKLMTLLNQTKNNFNCNTANTTDQKALILNLNDDCLEHICKNLPTDDQINFALTCQRFYDIVVMLSKVLYATFDSNVNFNRTPFQRRIFLQIVGSQIKTLKLHLRDESELILFGLFCTNVEKLKVWEAPNINSLCKLIEKMHLLQDLELTRITLTADFINYLIDFKHLKNLNVSSCSGVSGENIKLLCGLEKISLNGLSLTSCHFRDICKNLKKLHYLEIASDRAFLKTEDYEHIPKHLLQLQTLKLRCNTENINYKWIANLPKLKSLEIYGDVNEELLKSLLKLNADQLEELRLESSNNFFEQASLVAQFKKLKLLHFQNAMITNETILILSQLTELKEIRLDECFNVTDNAVLKLLENCLRLEHLYLNLSGDVLTPAFLPKALKLLQEQRPYCRSTDPVEITFSVPPAQGDFMDPDMNPLINEYRHLIKINVSIYLKEDDSSDDSYYYDNSYSDYYYISESD